jgi:hypothetical protein
MTDLPLDLIVAIEQLYQPAGMTLTQKARREMESADYGACRLGLDGHSIVFRVAKTTPSKIGQFVTLWKRPLSDGSIAPLDMDDGVTFVVVSVGDGDHRGQFVFSQSILVAKGVMSTNGKGGKRAIRVYPPWTYPVAKDAVKSQQWQLRYFLDLDQVADTVRLRELFEVSTTAPRFT